MTGRTRYRDQDIVLTSADAELIRGALVACSQLLRWAEHCHGALLAEATRAAEGGRAPGQLRYDVCLAIDYLDFAPAIRSRR
jgi:hypothetical protein